MNEDRRPTADGENRRRTKPPMPAKTWRTKPPTPVEKQARANPTVDCRSRITITSPPWIMRKRDDRRPTRCRRNRDERSRRTPARTRRTKPPWGASSWRADRRFAAAVGLESPTYVKSPEQNSMEERTLAATTGMVSPTDTETPEQNSRIEPGLAALHDGGPGEEEISAGTGDGDNSDFLVEIDRQKSSEWIRAGSARNGGNPCGDVAEIERERPPRGEGGATPAAVHGASGTRTVIPLTGPRRKPKESIRERWGQIQARTVGDSAELVNAGSAVTVRAGPT